MTVHTLSTVKDLENTFNSNSLAVVDHYSDWCPPCRAIAPKINDLALHYPNVTFGKVNIDNVPEIAKLNNITAMPTFIFYKDGKAVDKVVGANLNLIKKKIEQYK